MIYYVRTDGSILGAVAGATADDLKGITKVPDGCTAMFFDDVTHADLKANMGEFTIQNSYPVSTPIPAATKLANAQNAKLASLGASLANACSSFTSTALGVSHTYLSGESDMIKLSGEYAYVKGSDYKNEAIDWWTQDAGRLSHTGAQFVQMYLDARANVANQYKHFDTLAAQVKAATTVDAVNAIVW